jgi:cytochrome c-type biogenesis protein CcmH/NrfG/plastocyanin
MSAPKASGRVAAENELLARIGLPPSASPEDVDQLHLAVSQYLAAAPSSIRGWARAQAASLDEAYLQLTDPVGLEGSALSSPTRPPTVVPGGPATPPARRDPVPAVEAAIVAADLAGDVMPDDQTPQAEVDTTDAFDDTDTDDVDALFASVTPGAHRDLTSGGKPDKGTPAAVAAPAAPIVAPAPKAKGRPSAKPGQSAKPATAAVPPASSGPWKAVAIVATSALVVALLAFVVVPFVFNLGASGASGATTANAPSAQPSASQGPDMAQVSALMQKIAADPKDTDSLQQLGDLYYQANDYTDAGTFYDKLLAVDPKNVKGLLARGAVYYNGGDMTNAKKDWNLVVSIDPKNVEAHYDLGFLALNQTNPDWSTVQKEWQLVIQLDPGSDVATTVQQHLDALVAASMIPAPSGSASASGAPATSGSPEASGAPAASGAAAPSGSPAAASPAGVVVNETAKNLAFVNGTLNAPANTAFTIHYDNQDAGMPHDILIKDSTGKTVFQGDMVTGPTAVDYHVPALAAGTYTFTCSIHPTTMNGTLVVG